MHIVKYFMICLLALGTTTLKQKYYWLWKSKILLTPPSDSLILYATNEQRWLMKCAVHNVLDITSKKKKSPFIIYLILLKSHDIEEACCWFISQIQYKVRDIASSFLYLIFKAALYLKIWNCMLGRSLMWKFMPPIEEDLAGSKAP
jgi:hypothetical protein